MMTHNCALSLATGLLILSATSCTRIVDPDSGIRTDYLVFGRFAGECLGEHCVEIFKIENKALFEDTLDYYPPSTLYPQSFIELSDEQYKKVSHMNAIVPYEILSFPNGRIGNPDDLDQGGIYLELVKDGVRHYWLIDTMKARIPEFLHAFVDSAQAAVSTLQ